MESKEIKMDDRTMRAWRGYWDYLNKNLKDLERMLHMEETKEEPKMDDRTKKALVGSIEKWRKIAHDGGEDLGNRNCPLCGEFAQRMCRGCPVYEIKSKQGCVGTPYSSWKTHQWCIHGVFAGKGKKVLCKDCLTIATSEVTFLESLLPKEEIKMSEDKELKVMESRVKAAMEKCPQGKEILTELFYPKPKEEWKDVSDECSLEKHNSVVPGHCFLIREGKGGWGFWITSMENPCPDKFKIENGRIYRKS